MQNKQTQHCYQFEAEVHRLLQAAGVTVAEFFGRHPSMKDAKWTIAHFSYGQGKTPTQGAADWFDECVKPKLDTVLKAEERKALLDFAAEHGRLWKRELRAAWESASAGDVLQRLRNARSFGPAGLNKFTLPK